MGIIVVVQAAKAGIRIAKRLGYLGRRIDYTNPTNKFISKYVPPGYRKHAFRIQKAAEYATAGGLISELYNFVSDYYAVPKSSFIKAPSGEFGKTRSNMVKTGRRFRKSRREYCRRRPRRNRYRY